jgi:hypothetical protein
MSLYSKLQIVSSEEDVKDAYIKALNLKGYQKNLLDIQTKEVWFEAKDTGKHSIFAMFTQLLHYVQNALNKGEYVPPFLAVIDTKKAALMRSDEIIPFLAKRTIKWGKNASGYTQEALDTVSSYIGTHFVSFKIETHEEEFIRTVKTAIDSGEIIRIDITPDNLKQVFDKWVEMIGKEIDDVTEDDYSLLFFADIMHDGSISTHRDLPAELLHRGDEPIFHLKEKVYELNSKEGYRQFWTIYHKPPKSEYRDYLLERRDSLIPLDERSFKGAYYTPLNVVDKAYDKLAESLGKNWQKNYIVWDMCCGVGNLEVKHSNHRKIYMSTLDSEDINVMKATKTCVAAHRFQYDYLNDDISDTGTIDYNITNKMPEELRRAILKGKKILILINPPYAEASNRSILAIDATGVKSKAGVAKTKIASTMSNYGKASNELFIQFVARIAMEIPNATLAIFSTMKYVSAPNFEDFRNTWNAKYLGGFVVHNKAFDGMTGKFPIGFLIWKTNQSKEAKFTDVCVDVFDKEVRSIGEKYFFNRLKSDFLNVWIKRPRANKTTVVPLKNAVSPYEKSKCLSYWSDNAIGYMWCQNNDFQHAEQQTVIFSSVWGDGHGIYITEENLEKVAVVFSVRRLFTPTWLNDRDQFLQPTMPLPNEFKNDCLIWMLFNRSQRTAGADDLEWNGQKWSIINHFIPFTEQEVNAPNRFESDFMAQYLANKKLSKEAKTVLKMGKELWKAYFNHTNIRSIRDELKLNRVDVGWFQVRRTLQARNSSGDYQPISFTSFEDAYTVLTHKLQPQVFEFGFLMN